MQMMQRRTAAAEHSLKKAELRVRSAELRAQSAESELAQLRKVHAVSAHAMCHCVCNMAAFSTAICILSSMHQNGTPDVLGHGTHARPHLLQRRSALQKAV